MTKNYIPSKSIWPHEPWFSTHTGYESPVDRRRRTSGNEITRSPAAGSGSRQLRHREASRQVHTDAPLAATQMNNYTKGDLSKDCFKLFDVTN